MADDNGKFLPEADAAGALATADIFGLTQAATGNKLVRSTLGTLATFIKTFLSLREVLTAARTYYVRTDGSDANTGLVNTAGGAFLTVQAAVTAACALDLSVYSVTIQIANGTYAGAITLGNFVGVGPILIVGDNTTPTNVVLSRASGILISATNIFSNWQLSGVKMTTTVSGACISMTSSKLTVPNLVEFGACGGSQIDCTTGSVLLMQANYTISGSAARHINCTIGALVVGPSGGTITVSGTPAFSIVFLTSVRSSLIDYGSATFSGAATGTRYSQASGGAINTGTSLTSIPGDAVGTSDGNGFVSFRQVWQDSFATTVTSQTGTITTVGATSLQYRVEDTKTVHFTCSITITTNGTGATSLQFTLPTTPVARVFAFAARNTTSLKCGAGSNAASSATVRVTLGDGTYPVASGDTIVISGTYEQA